MHYIIATAGLYTSEREVLPEALYLCYNYKSYSQQFSDQDWLDIGLATIMLRCLLLPLRL